MYTLTKFTFTIGLIALSASNALYAGDSNGGIGQKISFVPSASAAMIPSTPSDPRLAKATGEPLVFSAPPRESAEEGERIYQPIAEHLSRSLGRKVEYHHPKSSLSYQSEMARGSYDITFEESHFSSWGSSHLSHTALVKIADENSFVVITRKDNSQITALKQLAGKKICAIGASDLGAMTVLAEFDPMRQPLVMENANWAKVYEGVMDGRCVAGSLPTAILRKLDAAGKFTHTLHRSRVLPSQSFSASPRVTSEEQAKLTKALLSTEGKRVLEPLLSANGAEAGLALTSKDEHAGMDSYLKNVWGFGH